MPFCFGDEGWGTMGVLKDWLGTAYWLVTKMYTGPSGQSAGIFGLWPVQPWSMFYINRTSTGIEFGANANTEFVHWTPSDCRLRDLYSYGIGYLELPENTWINLILGIRRVITTKYIQVSNPSSGVGHKLLVGARAEWHVDRMPHSQHTFQLTPEENNSELYIREYRASPPPTCYMTEFKWYKFYNVRRPTGPYGLSIGEKYDGGNKFVGALLETSIWVGLGGEGYTRDFNEDDRTGFRRVQGYALNPTAENENRPTLEVYWPLISDGYPDYKGSAQTGDLTAYTSGTSVIGDCYDWLDPETGAYEPDPPPPREQKSAGIITLERTAQIITQERSAEGVDYANS